jgi:hypothetical protein
MRAVIDPDGMKAECGGEPRAIEPLTPLNVNDAPTPRQQRWKPTWIRQIFALRVNLAHIRRRRYCLPCRCQADNLVLHGTFQVLGSSAFLRDCWRATVDETGHYSFAVAL